MRSRAAKCESVITSASGGRSSPSRSRVTRLSYGSASASLESTLPAVAAYTMPAANAQPALVPPTTASRAQAAVSASVTGVSFHSST